jgi:hypothetical protein
MTLWWWPAVTKLLLCGLSGAGKTTTGEQLKALGWTHFDCEKRNPGRWLADPLKPIPDDKNVVASWGFVPEFVGAVYRLTGAGFVPVWLGGDRELLNKSLRNRGEDEKFIADPVRVEQEKGLSLIAPVMVLDVFRPDGSRWDVTALLHDVFWGA